LWYYDSTLDNFFAQKVTKKEKKSLISPAKTKNEKNRNENENPIILALLMEQEAVLTNNYRYFRNCTVSLKLIKKYTGNSMNQSKLELNAWS